MNTTPVPTGFIILLKQIKSRIAQAQMRAVLSVNAQLVRLYWDIGRMIDARQIREGWGAAVIPRLARELHNELPEEKGFSERNIGLNHDQQDVPAPAVREGFGHIPEPVGRVMNLFHQ